MTTTSLADATAPVRAAAAAHAIETEQGRRLALPVVEAFEASGLGGLLAPKALGGSAAHPVDALRVIEAVTEADASAGWCVGIGIGSNYMASLVPEDTARTLFVDLSKGGAGTFGPGSMATPNGDGYRIAGRWPFASNCQQGGVISVGVIRCDDEGRPRTGPGGVELGLAFLAPHEFSIVDNWDMVGLRGTGSHDVTAELDLTADRLSSLSADKWPDDPLFRLSTFDVLGPLLAIVPVAIGGVALQLLREKTVAEANGDPRPGPRPRVSDDPIAQLAIAEAEVHLRSARSLLFDLLGEAMQTAERGDPPSRETSAMTGLACGECLRAGQHAVETASSLMGTMSHRDGAPMVKLRADVTAASSHIMFSHSIRAALGRDVAGVPTFAFPFLTDLG